MEIPQEAVVELKQIFKQVYNMDLTDQEAYVEAYDLLQLYTLALGGDMV